MHCALSITVLSYHVKGNSPESALVHHLAWLAGLLALVALAFGERAASAVAAAVIICGLLLVVLFCLFITYHGGLPRHV